MNPFVFKVDQKILVFPCGFIRNTSIGSLLLFKIVY